MTAIELGRMNELVRLLADCRESLAAYARSIAREWAGGLDGKVTYGRFLAEKSTEYDRLAAELDDLLAQANAQRAARTEVSP